MIEAPAAFLKPKPKPQLTTEARERLRAGQHKGLLHAVQKRKADQSANYATNFNHGQMAFDFERSAEAAGETREDLRSHFALLDRALLTLLAFFPRAATPKLPLHTDSASPRAPKLVRALALLLWRPLRLFRMQESWERLAICYRLQEMIQWRKKQGELTVERVEKLHWDLDAILENYLRHIEPRLKRIEKRFWKVWRVCRGMVGVAGAVFGARDTELSIADCRLPIEEERRFSEPETENQPVPSDAALPIADSRLPIEERRSFNRQSTIENRQSLVQFRGKPHYDQFHPTWLERIDEMSPQAIGNPFQSPSHELRAQRRLSQPAAVKDPAQWQEHPRKPRLPEKDFFESPASGFVRTPSERELRRLVRRGELTVPGSFEEFLALVEEALGPSPPGSGPGVRDSELPIDDCRMPIEERAGVNRQSTIENRQSPETRALAESLWNRMHAFSPRLAELHELLEATLEWVPNQFLPLWKKLLPPEYGYDAVSFFKRTHSSDRVDIAWGDDEITLPWHECKRRPAEAPRSEAEGRKKHGGELQHALRIWLHAVWHALVPGLRATHKVTVALYDWAVSRFGTREEFLQWRPNLSLAQLETRGDRPEWAVRVVTVTGKTLVKLSDGRIFEPAK